MGFDSGKVTVRVAAVKPKETMVAESLLFAMRGRALPAKRTDPVARYTGWVSPVHALDGDMTLEKCVKNGGDVLRFSLVQVERKIPAKLLQAKVAAAVDAYKREQGKDRLTKREEKDVKSNVRNALLPTMPELIGEIPAALDLNTQRLWVGATTERQWDAFIHEWLATFSDRLPARLLDFQAHCTDAGEKPNDLGPLSWAPKVKAVDVLDSVAADFLTWLLLRVVDPEHEAQGVKHSARPGVYIACGPDTGPIALVGEGARAKQIKIGKGAAISEELVAALRAGKKVVEMGLLVSPSDQEPYSFRFNRDWVFKGVKIYGNPKDHGPRLAALAELDLCMADLLSEYLAARKKSKRFAEMVRRVQESFKW